MTRFTVLEGNLLEVDADAIGNPTNSLQGPGGLIGQILEAGGVELIATYRELKLCLPGHTVITPGFAMRSHWVIHAVGPQWRGSSHHKTELLT